MWRKVLRGIDGRDCEEHEEKLSVDRPLWDFDKCMKAYAGDEMSY